LTQGLCGPIVPVFMLDLAVLDSVKLHEKPLGQRFIANTLLTPNYRFLPGVKIDLEGQAHLPNEPVFFAMNHTDRYNYWPFQWALWKKQDRFTATWVKGKNFENRFISKFMQITNNIPIVSRGYLVTRDFISVVGRRPSDDEYNALRAVVDGSATAEARRTVSSAILEKARNMLGRPFDPAVESYAEAIAGLFQEMMKRFVGLNRAAFDKNLSVLVFPQGTRSIRLSRGQVGLAQLALHFRRTIVPVGCNGSEGVYPGWSPIGRRGHIVYRLGKPITYETMRPFHVEGELTPLTHAAERSHGTKFRGLTDVITDRINDLLDEKYRYSTDKQSDGVSGTSRFV